MALASQTSRKGQSGHVYTSRRAGSHYRRRTHTRRNITILIGFIAVLFGGWWWLSGDSTPAIDPDTQLTANKGAEQTPSQTANTKFGLTNTPTRTARPSTSRPKSTATAAPKESPLVKALTMGERIPSGGSSPPPRAPTKTASYKASNASPSTGVQGLIEDADDAAAANELLIARVLLNRALTDSRAAESQRESIRNRLAAINEELLFSPRIAPGDPLTSRYVVKPGDSLAKIVAKQNLNVDWRLIQRINRISDPRRIRAGQTLKLVKGPFSAVISKSQFRLDLYASTGSTESGDDSRLFIRSFSVGLGQYNSTPTGKWIVRTNSKLINPPWTNPKTGEQFSADNPNNPIGERWIGIAGTDDETSLLEGYGIHGTIDPSSIGSEASMGCVRMLPSDVEIIYEMLVSGVSEVEITP